MIEFIYSKVRKIHGIAKAGRAFSKWPISCKVTNFYPESQQFASKKSPWQDETM